MHLLDHLPNAHEVELLWNILPKSRLVGGVVRDLLVQKHIADIDLATPEPPEDVINKLKHAGIIAVPTGLSHGTITAVINHHPYEITTLRKDEVTDGRHAIVVWTDSWEEDAARRDFTINAMSMDKNGTLFDFYNGQQDLQLGIIRFVGNAEQRIKEDVLRTLRFFRFYARYGKEALDPQAISAIQQTTYLLKNLSAERVWSELQRIFVGPIADQILQMMDEYKVLSELLPFGYNLELFQKLVEFDGPREAVLRLAALTYRVPSHKVAKHLRLSNQQSKLLKDFQLENLVDINNSEKQKRQLKADYDTALLIGQSWIKEITCDSQNSTAWDQWRNSIMSIPTPLFPLAGRDLLNIGVESGPHMGEYLKKIRKWWMDTGCFANKIECLQWFTDNN